MTTDRRVLTDRRVFKYPLPLTALAHTIDMPVGADIVYVHEQHGTPTMWAEVPDGNSVASIPRIFRLVPTGERVKAEWGGVYVGTVRIDWTVWHIYESVR